MSVLVEEPLLQGPFGAKGIGKLSLLGVAPAIGNTIYNAVGVRVRDLLLKPEKILAAMEEKMPSANMHQPRQLQHDDMVLELLALTWLFSDCAGRLIASKRNKLKTSFSSRTVGRC